MNSRRFRGIFGVALSLAMAQSIVAGASAVPTDRPGLTTQQGTLGATPPRWQAPTLRATRSGATNAPQAGGSEGAEFAASDSPLAPPVSIDGQRASKRTEPEVAINPTDPDNVIAGSIDYNYGSAPQSSIYVSHDGGASWESQGIVPLVQRSGVPMADCEAERGPAMGVDPVIDFDGEGNAYYTYLAAGCGEGLQEVVVSTDGGETWGAPSILGPTRKQGQCWGADRGAVAASEKDDSAIVAWVNIKRFGCDGSSDISYEIYSSTTKNGGRTWSPPKKLASHSGELYAAFYPSPVIAPDGRFFVAFLIKQRVDVNVCAPPSETNQLWLTESRSGRGGWKAKMIGHVCSDSYDTAVGLARAYPQGFTSDPYPSFSIDPADGTMYLAWADFDSPLGSARIMTSRDGGKTWGTPIAVGHAPRLVHMPRIVAEDGEARLFYAATTDAGLYDVFYRHSSDHGETWSEPFQLNTQTSCACYQEPGRWAFVGHYMGFDAVGGVIVPVWTDRRSRDAAQTIYTRRGTYR